jgi:hypothetical protein
VDVNDELERHIPHLCLYLVLYLEQKGGNKGDSAGSKTREPLFKLKYFWNFFPFLWGKVQELTPSPNRDKNLQERGSLGILTYLPHTQSLHC